jgi:hypothetical protein
MFEEAINYPRESEKGWTTVAIGGLLSLLSFLVIPVFLVLGYGARVLRDTMADPESEAAPVFDDWGALLVDGLKQFVVGLAYFLVPGVIVAVVAGGLIAAAVSGNGAVRVGAIIGALGGLLLAGVLFLVAYYLLPAALTVVAVSGRLGDAFDFGRMRALVTTREYAVRWAVGLGVLLVAGAVAGALSATGVGALVAPFVTFYGTVAAYYLYGGAVGVVDPESDESEPRPAVRPAA